MNTCIRRSGIKAADQTGRSFFGLIDFGLIDFGLVVFGLVVFGLMIMWPATGWAQTDIRLPGHRVVTAAVNRVADSVVQIETIGGQTEVDGIRIAQHPRTGTIVGREGYVVTASFNLAHRPDSILVRLADGNRLAASIIATNHARNVTLLKVDVDDLPAVDFLKRQSIQVGQSAIAVGRSMDANKPNLSSGIVSALQRIWGRAIQVDAAISPHNYGGPLIDLEGNALGILVPMSPQGQGTMDGFEWYDSGIGFAVPLDELRLAELVQGQDVFPGLAGVAFDSSRGYASSCVIAASPGNSPAALAGLRRGDRITSVAGVATDRVHQFRHAVGPLYAGEQVTVQYERDGKIDEAILTLVQKIEPWKHAMLGILAKPNGETIEVTYVLSGGPADSGGMQVGDKIVSVGDQSLAGSMEELSSILTSTPPGTKLRLVVERDEQPATLQLTTVALDAVSWPTRKILQAESAELIEFKLPEHANVCHAYFPKSDSASGLLMWVGQPGEFDQQAELAKWQAFCDQTNTALILPTSTDEKQWSPAEVEFLNKVSAQAIERYDIDKRRVAIAGQATGGVMASLVAMSDRETWQGLVLVDAPFSRRVRSVQSEPNRRQLILMVQHDGKEKTIASMEETANHLDKQGFAIHQTRGPADFREIIIGWIGSLGRL